MNGPAPIPRTAHDRALLTVASVLLVVTANLIPEVAQAEPGYCTNANEFAPGPLGNAAEWNMRPDKWWCVTNFDNPRLALHYAKGPRDGGRLGAHAVHQDDEHGDVEVSVKARSIVDIKQKNADYALVLGWQGANNYYLAFYHENPSVCGLYVVEDGERRPLEGGTCLLPVTLDNAWHAVSFRRHTTDSGGYWLEMTFDGMVVAFAEDPDATHGPGKVGMGSMNDETLFDLPRVEGFTDETGGDGADAGPIPDGGAVPDPALPDRGPAQDAGFAPPAPDAGGQDAGRDDLPSANAGCHVVQGARAASGSLLLSLLLVLLRLRRRREPNRPATGSRSRRPAALLLLPAVAAMCAGCASNVPQTEPPPPELEGLSKTSLAVGEPLRFEGHGFVSPDEGWVDVKWQGEFIPADDSAPEPVDLTVPLQVSDEGALEWERFGNYRIPFGTGDRIGTFEGTVHAVNRYFDGRSVPQREDMHRRARLEVEPSLVVLDFVAVGDEWMADCKLPSSVALNGVPYMMRVRAVGFSMEELEFEVSEGLLVESEGGGELEATDELTILRTDVSEDEHALRVVFADVPTHSNGYQASINAVATAVDGSRHDVFYRFTVRRPIEIYFDEPMKVAELYPPEPVSSCIPAGPVGTEVTYQESHSETRTRSIEQTTSTGWERTYGTEHQETWGREESEGGSRTRSRTVGYSDATTRGGFTQTTDAFSSTNGRSRSARLGFERSGTHSWNVTTGKEDYNERSVGAEGSAGVNIGVASLGGKAKGGYMQGDRSYSDQGVGGSYSSGVNGGVSGTNSSSATASHSRTQGNNWSRTRTYSEQNSYSESRFWQRTQSYSQAKTESRSIAQSLGESETEIFTVSTTDTEALHSTVSIVPGNFGIWYRQTARLVRKGTLVAYDLCGNGSEVGEIVLDDWTWAPELAQGSQCPPPSSLPPAQCFEEPCDR